MPLAPRLAQARRSRSLPSAAGLRRARRIAGATASWRRCARRRTGLRGSSRRTRPSSLRAGRGSGSWSASRAGAAARPRSAASRASRCRSWSPPTAAALDIPHESINASAGERVRAAHPDGQQPPQPDQGLPARLPRHRHQVPGQLSQMVPSHRTRRPTIAKSLPRGGNDKAMPTFHELSHTISVKMPASVRP